MCLSTSLVMLAQVTQFGVEQARKAAALAEQHAPSDADADARLEREAREEERAITQTCDELGVKMVEVCAMYPLANHFCVIHHRTYISDKPRRPLPFLRRRRPTCHPRRNTVGQSQLPIHSPRCRQLYSDTPRRLYSVSSVYVWRGCRRC